MNTTHTKRLVTALGAASLTVAAALSLGAGTSTADRTGGGTGRDCDCLPGKHLPEVGDFAGTRPTGGGGGGSGISDFDHSLRHAERGGTGATGAP